jgi:Helix-turn-helix of insertion element transposase
LSSPFLIRHHDDVVKGVYLPVRQDARKMRYIEWLTTVPEYRVPKLERDLAREMDVYQKTLYNWRQDKDFREVWQDEASEVIGNPDRRQAVMEVLYRAATDERNPRHVQAAKLYLEATGAIQPPKLDVTIGTKALGLLDDEELERLIARGAAELRAEADGNRPDGIPAEEHPG